MKLKINPIIRGTPDAGQHAASQLQIVAVARPHCLLALVMSLSIIGNELSDAVYWVGRVLGKSDVCASKCSGLWSGFVPFQERLLFRLRVR